MNELLYYIGIYLALINVYAFTIMGIDKSRAKKNQWRISEKHLLGAALIGGSFGALLGMRIFRHKTKHKMFQYGIPFFLIGHVMLLGYVVKEIFKI